MTLRLLQCDRNEAGGCDAKKASLVHCHRMDRPDCKRFVSCPGQSASTSPASEYAPRQDGDKRAVLLVIGFGLKGR